MALMAMFIRFQQQVSICFDEVLAGKPCQYSTRHVVDHHIA